ncbi:MAG: hypothetical protein LDL30_08130 [Desulfovibrio sp.]|nr:hypothetical protein [Desulfovibrio sp.]MCA1985749.1 hypothetical protein [Desulfovibrio sp.]
MRFHVASYVPPPGAEKTYARSPWPLLGAGIVCLLVFLAALAGWLGIFELEGQPLRWRISLEIAMLPLFLAGLCLYLARATLGQRSWLVKRYPDGLLLNARLLPPATTTPDTSLGEEGVSLFFLEWQEIAWAKLRQEVRYIKSPIPGNLQRRDMTFVELGCASPQTSYLRRYLQREAGRQDRCVGEPCPVEYVEEDRLLLRWDVSPGPEEFLAAIAPHVAVLEPTTVEP